LDTDIYDTIALNVHIKWLLGGEMRSAGIVQGKYSLFFLVVIFCLSLWPSQAISASRLATQRMYFKDARVALDAWGYAAI